MKVSLVSVNYNGSDELLRLLKSLRDQTDSSFEVIVVDNDSKPHDRTKLEHAVEQDFSSVDLISSPRNLGFAGASNLGLAKAFKKGADWVLLINPDTWVETDFIARLKGVLGPSDGLVGLAINEGSRTVYGGSIQWLKPTLQHIHKPERIGPDTYAIGAAMAISRRAYQTIGGLDEKYFLYFEDADYSIRAYRAGIPLTLTDDVVVRHAVSAVTGKMGSPFLFRHHYRSALRFNFKHGPLWAVLLAVPWSGWVAMKQWLKILLGRNAEASKGILAGFKDFYVGYRGDGAKIRVGIECESIEGKNPVWGVGKMIIKLLEQIAAQPELAETFEFILYFKDEAPDLPFLKSPMFEKKIAPVPLFRRRLFPIYYYLLLPIKLWFERLNVMFWPNYMLPIIAFNRSFALLTEDIYYEAHEGKLPFRYRLAYRIFGWWTAHCASRVMTISETSKKNVARLYRINPRRIIANPLGVDIEELKEGGTVLDYPYLLYVGQAFPRRHLRETILAFKEIGKEFSSFRLITIGPDKYETPTIDYIVKTVNLTLGREAVSHRDYVPQEELAVLYRNAAALLYVSDREAFGLPPMEALALGVPPIIADNELGRELFEDNAFYATEASPSRIAAAMREALTDTAKVNRIKTEGPAHGARYSWLKFTERWLTIVKTLV
ncbi:MAG TPA: glycosyltransferase [Candidatus Paceibacterota bacterium]|nr:glycosyltransferase [Candidatus Paceibacterota bacterium]